MNVLKLVSSLVCVIAFVSCSAQKGGKEEKIVNMSDSGVYLVVDEMPQFMGDEGDDKLLEYFKSSTKRELSLKQKKNKTFTVQLIIDVDGSISNYEFLEGAEGELKEEVKKMIKGMPKWTAGKHQGNFVKVSRRINVSFK